LEGIFLSSLSHFPIPETTAQKGAVIIGVGITGNKEISEPTIQFLRSLKIK